MLGDVFVFLVLCLLFLRHREINKKIQVRGGCPFLSCGEDGNCFRARPVYVGGLLVYSLGMLLMAVTKHKVGVIIFSWTAGVMYSTLFTMPYLLVAHYHSKETVCKFAVIKIECFKNHFSVRRRRVKRNETS